MIARKRSAARGGAALLALLLAVSSSGCATAGAKQDAEQDRKRAGSHFNIAADHVANGRLEMALRELLTAQRLDPRNPEIEHALAIAYLRKGKAQEAETHLLGALEKAPDYHEARYNLSTLLLNQGRYAECLAQSERLFDDATFSEPWRALTNGGWALYRLGRVDEARGRFARSLEFRRNYWPTLLNLGILEMEQGNRSEAIAHLSRSLELDPGPSAAAEANYRLAEIYVSLGKRRQAIGHLRTAVVKAPSDPWGKKSEEYLRELR